MEIACFVTSCYCELTLTLRLFFFNSCVNTFTPIPPQGTGLMVQMVARLTVSRVS